MQCLRRTSLGFLGVSFTFGLSLLALVYAIGPISGCHINPAVTVSLFLSKTMHARDTAGYIVAQVVGAIVAAGVLLLSAQGLPTGYDPAVGGLVANGYGEHSPAHYSLGAAIGVEIILTGFLILTV